MRTIDPTVELVKTPIHIPDTSRNAKLDIQNTEKLILNDSVELI